VREELDVLERTGDAPFGHPVRATTHNRLALPPDVARLRVVHLADAVEDRGFAGPIGTDYGEQLSRTYLEGHISDGLDTLERQADAVKLQKRVGQPGFGHDSHRLRRL